MKRTKVLQIRLTDDEHAAVAEAASKAEQSVSDYARSALLATYGTPASKPLAAHEQPVRPALKGLAGLVGRLPTQQDTTSKALK